MLHGQIMIRNQKNDKDDRTEEHFLTSSHKRMNEKSHKINPDHALQSTECCTSLIAPCDKRTSRVSFHINDGVVVFPGMF